MALFSSGARSQSHHHSQNLVEFRAGKMALRDRMVHADKRKGLIYIHQSDDMLMHFCWKDRNTGNVEDDLIIFPDDTEFVSVKECKTGRVFLLKFKSSSRKLFFWMQEPKSDKDEEYCRKVNDVLNNPPAPGSTRTRGSRGGNVSDQLSAFNQALGLGADDSQLSALAGMDQQQLMQFLIEKKKEKSEAEKGEDLKKLAEKELREKEARKRRLIEESAELDNLMGGTGSLDSSGLMSGLGLGSSGSAENSAPAPAITFTPSLATPSSASNRPSTGGAVTTTARQGSTGGDNGTASTPSGAAAIQLSDLQNILAGMNIPQDANREPPAALEEALSNSEVVDVVQEDRNAERLLPHLPTEEPIVRDREEVSRTVRSPQFRQTAGIFGSAFQTGQLGPLVRQFGFSDRSVDAADRGDIQSFAELLENSERSASSETATPGSSASKEDQQDKRDDKSSKSKKSKPDDEEMELD